MIVLPPWGWEGRWARSVGEVLGGNDFFGDATGATKRDSRALLEGFGGWGENVGVVSLLACGIGVGL